MLRLFKCQTILKWLLHRSNTHLQGFVFGPGIPGVRSMGPDICPRCCVDLTDVTLADEDTKSISTDNAKRAINGNVAMHVRQPGGQLWNQC